MEYLMKNNTAVCLIEQLAKELGCSTSWRDGVAQQLSDDLFVKADEFSMLVCQVAPYRLGRSQSVYYAEVKYNWHSYIGMYTLDEVADLLKGCISDLDEALKGFI